MPPAAGKGLEAEPRLPTPEIAKMRYNPANFAYRIGTGPWSVGYAVSHALRFYDSRSRSEHHDQVSR
jgi:hypothetical protein